MQRVYFTMDDFDFSGKTVAVRIDVNSAIDASTKKIIEFDKLKAAVPTLVELSEKGAKTIAFSHQGQKEKGDLISLGEHAQLLTKFSGKKIEFAGEVFGEATARKIKEMKPGEILLLDNIRFLEKESKEKSAAEVNEDLPNFLLEFIDFFVFDAFPSAHRPHATTRILCSQKPSCMGRSMQAEYEGAMRVMDNAEKPLVLVLGGFKPDDCYRVAKHFLENGIADKLVCGGVFGNECLMTQGISLGEAQEKQYADNNFLYVMDGLGELVKKHSQKLVLPVDLAFEENGSRKEARVSALPRDKLLLDLGSESIELFCREIKAAKTVYLKGPMGKFEDARFSEGTRRVFETSLDSGAFTAVGGGHTETAFQKLGLDSNRISFKSLSGGAFVTLLSGGELPALNALVESRKKFGK